MEVHRKDGDIENRPVSKGGKLFDFLTYFGLATVATFFATIPLAKMFTSGRFKFIADKLHNGLKNVGASDHFAAEAVKTTNYMWGGNLMLIAVGAMEYFRTPMVKFFNRAMNDPTDPKSIEDAPPQTVGSILKGRLVAWSTVFIGFNAITLAMGKEGYNKLLDSAGNAWAKLRNNPKSFENGRLGAEDGLATISSAALLYIGSHFFAKRAYERRVEKDYLKKKQADEPVVAAPTTDAAPTPAANDKPLPQISQAQHERALERAPQLSA